jgi:hypothetical protein
MGIDISIKAGLTKETSSVGVVGSVQHVITDTEVKTFGIQDKALKNAIGKDFGKNPNAAYLRSPTPGQDLYKTYDWPQVETVLLVESATITGITSEPVIVATQVFSNTSRDKKGTFNVSISDLVANTATSTWSTTNTITVEQKFTYKVEFMGLGAGGETSMSYSQEWGEIKTETLTVTVGTTSGVTMELNPGQSVEAILSASRGKMKIRIVYKAYLIGDSAVHYDPPYKGHYFWALDIGEVMRSGGIPNLKTFTQDIEIGFYSKSKIEIKDLPSGQVRTVFSEVARWADPEVSLVKGQ